MKILDKIYNWLFIRLFKNSIQLERTSISIDASINIERCKSAYSFIDDSIKEINELDFESI